MLSINNISDDLLTMYGFYACILAAQIVSMSYLTGQARLRNKVSNLNNNKNHGMNSIYRHEMLKVNVKYDYY